MAIGLAALGLLAFLLGCSGTFAEPQNSEPAAKCSLTGTWKSDLGNTMEIYSVSDTGMFRGVIFLDRRNPPYIFRNPLLGIQHQGSQPTFSFTVGMFGYYGFIALFVGHCMVHENGKEQLKTTWLQLDPLKAAGGNWEPTRFGRSTFYRREW